MGGCTKGRKSPAEGRGKTFLGTDGCDFSGAAALATCFHQLQHEHGAMFYEFICIEKCPRGRRTSRTVDWKLPMGPGGAYASLGSGEYAPKNTTLLNILIFPFKKIQVQPPASSVWKSPAEPGLGTTSAFETTRSLTTSSVALKLHDLGLEKHQRPYFVQRAF